MVGESAIDVALVNRELSRFAARIGLKQLPEFVVGRALVFKLGEGRFSLELDVEGHRLLMSYGVTVEHALLKETLKKSLEKSVYLGGMPVTVAYLDPYITFMVGFFSYEISAEYIENGLLRLIKQWEEIRNGG